MKKNREVLNPNIFVVINPKGGVGKSAISKYFLPAILIHNNPEAKISIYEIDNNNANTKNVFENSDFTTYRKFKINDKNEAIFDLELSTTFGEYAIVDVGGGDDVFAVLDGLKDIHLTDVNFIIPTNDDDEQFENVVDCIEKILLINRDANIRLVLNQVKDCSETQTVEDQFVAFYGDRKLGIESSLPKIEKYLTCISIIPRTNILFLVKNKLKIGLADFFIKGKKVLPDVQKIKAGWLLEAKETGDREAYIKKADDLSCMTQTVEYVTLLATNYFKL